MTEVLEQIELPDRIIKSLHSKNDFALARIRLLQRALRVQEEQLARLVPESVRNDIDLSLEEVGVALTLDFMTPVIPEQEVGLPIPEYLSVRDVSRLTGLVPQVIRRHCQSGKYKADQPAGDNGSWRILPEQFKHLSNWRTFLREKEKERQNSIKIAELGMNLWSSDEGPIDRGTK